MLSSMIYEQLIINSECKYLFFILCNKIEFKNVRWDRNISNLSEFQNQIKEATITISDEIRNNNRIYWLIKDYIQILMNCIKDLYITELIFNGFSDSLLDHIIKGNESVLFQIINFLRLENLIGNKINWKDFSKTVLNLVSYCYSIKNTNFLTVKHYRNAFHFTIVKKYQKNK